MKASAVDRLGWTGYTRRCAWWGVLVTGCAAAQTQPTYLDPSRAMAALQMPPATALPEQFIWTKGDAAALNPAYQAKVRGQDDKTATHYFRRRFQLTTVPGQATLYVAGPRSATVMLNGVTVMTFSDAEAGGKGFHVMHADVAGALKVGENVLAIAEVRGHSSLHTGAGPVINQVTYGEVLAVKIVARGVAEDAAPVVVSDGSWRSSLEAAPGWSGAGFEDSGWAPVQTLGALGSRTDFLQWNADAGLYAWPGYAGISPAMRTFRVVPLGVPKGLTARKGDAVTLDFGEEISGRVRLVSGSDRVITVETSYGESAEETMGHAYLGTRAVMIPAHGEAYGPKSAFRYVRLSFPDDGEVKLKAVEVQGIMHPVEYQGEFESSDRVLNRIWETGAYTAHLCMLDGIWDAPKRDRGRWMGDLDVTGRVISSVFGERELMEETMTDVIGDEPVTRDVNTIAGYSALWVTGQADFYRHSGDLAYLKRMHGRLLQLLTVMDAELDDSGLFTNPEKRKVFVDWSDGFSADTPDARIATQMEFYLAYREAAYLLHETGDTADAAGYTGKADRLKVGAQAKMLDGATKTFGARWQSNAMAVVSGAATAEESAAIWTKVLSHVAAVQAGPMQPKTVVTPYYGFYVLEAMARLGHRDEALKWMREYWGGMLAEGATSFWEAYDPRWPKEDFHRYLEADGKKGYYASLAHGWASGPTAWLMQQVLGIEPTGAGFETVRIRPDLAGLEWAKGAEPTPRGLIRVSVDRTMVKVSLPAGTVAEVSLPYIGRVLENGRAVSSVGDDGRSVVTLRSAGEYTFTAQGGVQ